MCYTLVKNDIDNIISPVSFSRLFGFFKNCINVQNLSSRSDVFCCSRSSSSRRRPSACSTAMRSPPRSSARITGRSRRPRTASFPRWENFPGRRSCPKDFRSPSDRPTDSLLPQVKHATYHRRKYLLRGVYFLFFFVRESAKTRRPVFFDVGDVVQIARR